MTRVAIVALVIACQAMIAVMFSIINQSLTLGYFPQVKVVHTSNKIHWQVYFLEIN